MKTVDRALMYAETFEQAGKPVKSVEIDGRKIRLILGDGEELDEFDTVDMNREKRAS